MSESPVYRPHPEAPARATLRPESATGAWTGLHAQHFEVVSRGDFVPGLLYQPKTKTHESTPLLLLQHGVAEGMLSKTLECAAAWVEKGLAVATIDLPLHGERASTKLSERLFWGVAQLEQGSTLDPETFVLVEEFARQSTSDLVRTLDALASLPSIDARRIAFMGFGLGASAGSYLLAHDLRPRAAVLVMAKTGLGPADLDPATYLAKARDTSLLIVTADQGDADEMRRADAFFDATAQPKERLQIPGDPGALPDVALAKIWRFLAKELDL